MTLQEYLFLLSDNYAVTAIPINMRRGRIASIMPVSIVLIMRFILKAIKCSLGGRAGCNLMEHGIDVAARYEELSTKDTCHLERQPHEKCTAAADEAFWLRINARFRTRARRSRKWSAAKIHCDRLVQCVCGKS